MKETKKLALITGASGGIGEELVRIHAARKGDLILVARSEDKLLSLKKELEEKEGIRVLVIVKDLSEREAPQQIFDEIKEKELSVEYLINNAGFGDHSLFAESNWPKIEAMIHVNVRALTELTRLFLPEMISRGSGRIMNLGSVASFVPGPLMAVYHATKYYVLAFSQAIAEELDGTGVSVTCLCPGPTKSGFQEGTGMKEGRFMKRDKMPSAVEVAEYGYQKMLKAERLAVPGGMNKVLKLLSNIVPSGILTKAAMKAQEPL